MASVGINWMEVVFALEAPAQAFAEVASALCNAGFFGGDPRATLATGTGRKTPA
jgi:hypothetical protein